MSERQAEINSEILYFIATGEDTVRSDIERTFDNYNKDELEVALTGLAMTGCIDCQNGLLLVTSKGRTRVEEYKRSLPKTVRKF